MVKPVPGIGSISIPKIRFLYIWTACSRPAPVYMSIGTWVSMYTLQLIYNRIPKVRFPCFCTACIGAALGSRVCSGAAWGSHVCSGAALGSHVFSGAALWPHVCSGAALGSHTCNGTALGSHVCMYVYPATELQKDIQEQVSVCWYSVQWSCTRMPESRYSTCTRRPESRFPHVYV